MALRFVCGLMFKNRLYGRLNSAMVGRASCRYFWGKKRVGGMFMLTSSRHITQNFPVGV